MHLLNLQFYLYYFHLNSHNNQTQNRYYLFQLNQKKITAMMHLEGAKGLEDNLDYIANVLDKKRKESSRETINRYFLKDFFKHHLQVYQNKPIYELIDDQKNGSKFLIYIHRHNESNIDNIENSFK